MHFLFLKKKHKGRKIDMMKLVIWDVQHGSAAYLKTPSGKHIVIDLGSGDFSDNSAFSPLQYLKDSGGVKQLDEVIITHPHTDHIDDILNWDLLSPKVLLRPKHLSEEDILKANPSKDKKKINKYIEINKSYSHPVNPTERPTDAKNNGGVNISTFSPSRCGTSNINNHSIVTIMEYLGVKIIVPGDNEAASWKELLEDPSFITAIKGTNIFVASHHGRESGYYSDLFNYFSPELVIVSDGPNAETSVTDKYSKLASGWTVYKRSENETTPYERKCLTTRKDGSVVIKVGKSTNGVFMNVTID